MIPTLIQHARVPCPRREGRSGGESRVSYPKKAMDSRPERSSGIAPSRYAAASVTSGNRSLVVGSSGRTQADLTGALEDTRRFGGGVWGDRSRGRRQRHDSVKSDEHASVQRYVRGSEFAAAQEDSCRIQS
jgi:hypothetical protein